MIAVRWPKVLSEFHQLLGGLDTHSRSLCLGPGRRFSLLQQGPHELPRPIPTTRKFRCWLKGLLVTASLVLLSIRWLDRPTALWVHSVFGGRRVPEGVIASPIASVPLLTVGVFSILGVAALMGRKFSKLENTLMLCDISVLATELCKDQFKITFGRTWPDSWAPHVVSLIRDNAYGFHFLQSNQSFGSFPSGHAAAVAAVVSVLWMELPKLRPFWAFGMAAVDLGLILLNLHFISDVIAGAFLGMSMGSFTMALSSKFG